VDRRAGREVSKLRKRVGDRNGTPGQRYDFVKHCERLIAEKIKARKYHENPALETALIDGFDPAVALIEMCADPALEPGLRAATAAKLLPFWHKEQSLLVKEAGGQSAATQIVIQIASWAGSPDRTPKVIELQPAVDVEATARRINSPASAHAPEPSHDRRDRLAAAASASATAHIVEVDPSPASPRRVIGEVSMRGGLKRKPAFEPRAHEAAPDLNVKSDFDPFK
jgi:hypothetical protein